MAAKVMRVKISSQIYYRLNPPIVPLDILSPLVKEPYALWQGQVVFLGIFSGFSGGLRISLNHGILII